MLDFARGTEHLADTPPRIEMVNGTEQVNDVLTFMIGSYGLVRNAPHLLVGILPTDDDRARIDLGFVLEHVVLEATRLGLGTCWITGTYDPREAGDVVGLEPGEDAAAVCTLGHPAEEGYGRFHTRTIRRLAGGHRRKPLPDIVFDERWNEPWAPEEADPDLVSVMEHARLAPSARNAQPWRFIVEADRITLAVVERRFIDAGIVMSHVSLASAAVACDGRWTIRLRDRSLARELGIPDSATTIATFDLAKG